jgi:hypothetical protein
MFRKVVRGNEDLLVVVVILDLKGRSVPPVKMGLMVWMD